MRTPLSASYNNNFRTESGFRWLYEENVKKLFVISYSRVSDREEAEEIVHDVFRSVWERRYEITDEEGSIKKYLVRAVKLKVIDYYRKQERNRRNMAIATEDYCGHANCTDDQLHLNELEGRLTELVDQLPCRCRQVYQMSREQGMTNQQIASTLLISEKSVESHITKALSHLRQNLTNYSYLGLLLLGFFK
ncbi:MAG: RNA polymerase sigma-70 factor [Cyclobacteriaceae bacterium]